MALDREEIIATMQKQRYMSIPCALSEDTLLEGVALFQDFLALPNDLKTSFAYSIRNDGGMTLGHYLRTPGTYGDSKQYFHWHPSMLNPNEVFGFEEPGRVLGKNADGSDLFRDEAPEQIIERLETAREHPTIEKFLQAGQQIHDGYRSTLDPFLAALGGDDDTFMPKMYPTKGSPHFVIRFLAYNPPKGEAVAAKGHIDRGPLTIALYETQPGLAVGTTDEDAKIIPYTPKEARVMMGGGMRDLLGASGIESWHLVKELPENKGQRISIVGFTSPVKREDRDYAALHTPLHTLK